MISKRKPIRDKKHLQFVSELPCLKCDSSPCDPHHLKTMTDGGIGIKPSDSWAVPLCRAHHTELHNQGEKTFFVSKLAAARHLAVALYCANGNQGKALEAIGEWHNGD